MARLRVLQSFPAPRETTNPYVIQLLGALRPRAHVDTFTWRQALLGPYDVIHLHWPENLLRATTPVKRARRRALLAGLLLRLRVADAAVVRTLHNATPHEPLGRLDERLLSAVNTRTDAWITLNDHTPAPAGAWTRTIPHGHYRDWFAEIPVPEPEPGRLAFVGLIRPYKNVPALLDAFSATDQPDLALRVVGSPADSDLRERLESLAAADSRISLLLDYVDDATMATEIGRSALIVLPYAYLDNSGAALLALSLNRPVLLPSTPSSEALADEVGTSWVRTFRGPLDAEVLAHAARWASGPRSDTARLTRRDWETAAEEHLDVYRAAVARRRVTPRRENPTG